MRTVFVYSALFSHAHTIPNDNQGCHDCGKPTSNEDRRAKFDTIVSILGDAQAGVTPAPSITSVNSLVETESPTLKTSSEASNAVNTNFPSKSPVSGAPAIHTTAPVSGLTSLGTNSPTRSYVPIVTTSAPISNTAVVPTTSPTSMTADTLSPEELSNRLGFANGYCASSIQDAKDNCASTLKTCNEGDPPCIMGTACFTNIVCTLPVTADLSQSPQGSSNNPERSHSPSFPPTPSASLTMTAISCGHICLRPLTEEECTGAGNAILVFSDCVSVGVGQVCQSLGECGPKALIHNCRGDSAFMRVLPDQCGQISTDDISTGTTRPSSHPSSTAVSLNDALTDQTSQYSQQDFGSIENAWWRDVSLNSSLIISASLPHFLIVVSFILFHLL